MLVRTTYLEQRSPAAVRPARVPAEAVDVVRVRRPAPEFSRFLYATVGGDWHWRDRLPWTRDTWLEYLSRRHVETWVAWLDGAPAGYVELAGSSTVDGLDVEIAYFGLLPGFLGMGLGGHLLTTGLRLAWTMDTRWPDPVLIQCDGGAQAEASPVVDGGAVGTSLAPTSGRPSRSEALARPVRRIWVHTCSLDGPAALANYQARGLVAYRTEEAEEDVPDSPPGSWPVSS